MHLHTHEIVIAHAAGEATIRVTRPLARVLVAARERAKFQSGTRSAAASRSACRSSGSR